MNRFSGLVLGLAALPLFAAPAAADDGRRHVMTATQQIYLARDLPDDAGSERDGVKRPSADDGSSPVSMPSLVWGKLGWPGLILIVMMSTALYWVRRTLRRAMVREMQGGWESHRPAKDRDSFEARLAARLAELEGGGDVPEPASYQPPTAAAARGFGRKGA